MRKSSPTLKKTNILGVTFDYNINMKEHIDQRINAAKHTLARLNRIRSLKTDIQLMLFKTLCFPQVFFFPTALIYSKKYRENLKLHLMVQFHKKTLTCTLN